MVPDASIAERLDAFAQMPGENRSLALSLEALMDALGRDARRRARIYLTGGATAVLLEWRASTVDVDLTLEPDHDELYRAIATLKDSLGINIEVASPAHFIPELPGWRERSAFIRQSGTRSFRNS